MAHEGVTDGAAARKRAGDDSGVWRRISVVVLVIILLSGGVTAWSLLSHQSRTERRTFWQQIKTVEVDSGSAKVSVEAGAADRVTLKESLGWVTRRPSVNAQVVGSTLRVAVSCGGPISVIGCDAALDIQVPAATGIHTQGSSGDTYIRGVSGEIRAKTVSGQLWLESVSGVVWAKSASGEIVAKELGSSVVQTASSSGQMSLGFARPPESVTATTTSGPVVITVPGENMRYHVGGHTLSHSWSIDPDVEDSGSKHTIDITTMSGSVTVASGSADSGAGPTASGALASPGEQVPTAPAGSR
ncbi:DUF4097 family beta strand repeat-containing protein [Kitasatospora sp. NPDC056138]|uniref:DUF4097 family beta strand repeat-containing protein n=1 Tax=Kitasatospora sp. NPDC056138 TaxID=3345724 RepID=UPI0035E06090